MANERIDGVILNISGDKTTSKIRNASISLRKNKPINETDINKVLEKGLYKINVENNELIHCQPMNYRIDNGEELKDPMNIYGEELSMNILLGMYPSILYKNLSMVVEESHLDIDNKVLSAYASGMSCLVEDEKEYGATIVDIGGGVTSIATFKNGFPVAFSSLPVGGINITKDIVIGLNTSFAHAEDLKNRHGCAFMVSHDEYESLDVYPMGEEDDSSIRQIHRLANQKNHRVVLTGGCSQLPGINQVAGVVLDKQVRLGNPRNIPNIPEALNNPTFSTVLGLLSFATGNAERKPKKVINRPAGETGKLSKIFNWLRQNS